MNPGTVEQDGPSKQESPAATRAAVILAVVISAAFLDVVDFSIVQVALPTIQVEFQAPATTAQWILGVYGLTLAGFLMVSGRAGFEIVQKALAARIPAVCSVSAPSSLAADLARESGMILVGFLRGESMNVYSGSEHLIG